MDENIAKQSMIEVLREKRILDNVQKDDLSHTPKIMEALILFGRIFAELDTTGRFVVRDICNWAEHYYKQLADELPYILSSTYSLGKFIKTYLEELPFEYLGTYGNRAVYKVKEDIND